MLARLETFISRALAAFCRHSSTQRAFSPLRACRITTRLPVLSASADSRTSASGTATVQTALHGKPMVVVYRVSPLEYRVGRRFVKVDTFAMVNLIAGRRVVTELIQDDLTPDAVAAETVSLLRDEGRASAMRDALAEVRARLGGPGGSRRAAQEILRTIKDTCEH